jgi:hypothetical protein
VRIGLCFFTSADAVLTHTHTHTHTCVINAHVPLTPPPPFIFPPSISGTQTSFNARCAESNDATNASDAVNYAVGTMVWTLFDYYGEPPVGGPEVSSTYGQYDLCGFPKAAAFWYRTQVR